MWQETLTLWKKAKHSRPGQYLTLLNQDIEQTDIFNHAYAMAYVTLFSLVPSLAAIFALISLFTPMFGENSTLLTEARQLILKHLATGSGEQAISYFEDFLSNTDFKKIGMTGFGGMVVTLTFLLRRIELALNRIFEIDQPRTLYMRFIYFWTFLTLGTFSIALAAGAISSTTWGADYLEASLSLRILNDLIYGISLFGFFFMLYKVVPNRFIPVKQAAIGGLFATVLFSGAVQFFSLYISRFTKYEAIYGALAALPIFLFWLYVIWLITLLGAAVTKRGMEGIPEKGVKEEEQHPHLQNQYFHCLLPFITLLKIYESFEKSKGQGAVAQDIANQLSVSLGATRKAIQQLLHCDLVLASHLDEAASAGLATYFPRQPSHQVKYGELKQKLLGSEAEWLAETKIPPAMQQRYKDEISHLFTGSDRFLVKDVSSGGVAI